MDVVLFVSLIYFFLFCLLVLISWLSFVISELFVFFLVFIMNCVDRFSIFVWIFDFVFNVIGLFFFVMRDILIDEWFLVILLFIGIWLLGLSKSWFLGVRLCVEIIFKVLFVNMCWVVVVWRVIKLCVVFFVCVCRWWFR